MVTAGKLRGLKLANLITYPLFQHVFKMCARTQRMSVVGLLIIAGMQCFLYSDNAPFFGELAHRYGSPTRNQRVENWRSHFRKSMASWWINFF